VQPYIVFAVFIDDDGFTEIDPKIDSFQEKLFNITIKDSLHSNHFYKICS